MWHLQYTQRPLDLQEIPKDIDDDEDSTSANQDEDIDKLNPFSDTEG